MFLDAYWVCQNKGSIFVLDQMGEKVGSERVMLLTCLLIRERERDCVCEELGVDGQSFWMNMGLSKIK